MSTPSPAPVQELLLEYQYYVLAYRLRAEVGGLLSPRGPQLRLSEYATLRNERQHLARQLVSRASSPLVMRRVDDLTEQLLFGFWHNPAQVAEFLRVALRQEMHPALGDAEAFAALLTLAERARLGPAGVGCVVRHCHACLTLAGLFTSPQGMDAAWAKIEAERMPLFIDELPAAQRQC